MGVTCPETIAAGVERWRAARLQRLTAPDGWLSLVGLAWLTLGDTSIGSAADNHIVVAGLPAHLGVVTLDARGEAGIELHAGADGRIEGVDARQAMLLDDEHPQPTVVVAGDVSFLLVRRGDKVGLRIRNVRAATREHFLGLDYFPIDASWRIEAQWRPAEPGQVLEMATVIGTIEPHAVAGTASFDRDGRRFHLLPVVESPGDEEYFVVFADQTQSATVDPKRCSASPYIRRL